MLSDFELYPRWVPLSIATLKQMLDVQQSMLKTLFDSFISTVNARVDKLADSVASLKASLEFTQKDVGDLSSLKSKLVGAEKDIVEIKNTVELQGNKIEYQENQSRRNNIRVFGIPESAGETWEMAETKVKDAIKEKLNIEVDIERAHRVERRKSGGINQHQADAKPRVIVCRLSSWKQKEAVVRKARKEKPEGLFICEDLYLPILILLRERLGIDLPIKPQKINHTSKTGRKNNVEECFRCSH